MAYICDHCLAAEWNMKVLALFVISTSSPESTSSRPDVKRTAVCAEHAAAALTEHMQYGSMSSVVSAD